MDGTINQRSFQVELQENLVSFLTLIILAKFLAGAPQSSHHIFADAVPSAQNASHPCANGGQGHLQLRSNVISLNPRHSESLPFLFLRDFIHLFLLLLLCCYNYLLYACLFFQIVNPLVTEIILGAIFPLLFVSHDLNEN